MEYPACYESMQRKTINYINSYNEDYITNSLLEWYRFVLLYTWINIKDELVKLWYKEAKIVKNIYDLKIPTVNLNNIKENIIWKK